MLIRLDKRTYQNQVRFSYRNIFSSHQAPKSQDHHQDNNHPLYNFDYKQTYHLLHIFQLHTNIHINQQSLCLRFVLSNHHQTPYTLYMQLYQLGLHQDCNNRLHMVFYQYLIHLKDFLLCCLGNNNQNHMVYNNSRH